MDIFLQGLGVGFVIAAAVGPISLLCIRRTFNDGGIVGFASGLGAATADGLYGFMVAAGFTATGLLLSYATPFAIGGGSLIALLGLLSIRSFFCKTKPPEPDIPGSSGKSIAAAYGTTFVLTMSNPMTVLSFIGLVSGLAASAATDPTAPYWLVFGVFLGSTLWWVILVQAVLLAKRRIPLEAIRWLDLVSGSVLLIWGVYIVVQAF